MPVITISADAFEKGREIAQAVADRLGWDYLGRQLLTTLAEKESLPEAELLKALEEPPGFLGMRPKRRRQLLNHVQAACLDRLAADDQVCYGLGAHLYVKGVSHVLKVRIITDLADRARTVAGVEGMPRERAEKLAKKAEQERRRWSTEFFGEDETDAAIYDLVISLSSLEPAKAVEIITDAAGYTKFQPMTYSKKCMQDMVLASKVRLKLMESFPDIRVLANDGTVVAHVKSLKRDQRKKQEAVRRLAGEVPGVEYVEVHVINDIFGQAVESGR